jgi:hypothetical protein
MQERSAKNHGGMERALKLSLVTGAPYLCATVFVLRVPGGPFAVGGGVDVEDGECGRPLVAPDLSVDGLDDGTGLIES